MAADQLVMIGCTLLQAATVCSKFREAAYLIASLKLGLDTRGEHYTLPRLDSALLLRWAGRMQSVHLYDETLSLPGIAELLSAATTLTKIELDCMSSAAAARAEELLAGCTSVTAFSLDGQFTPSSFPKNITTLSVEFSEEIGSYWEPAQAQMLVVGISRLQQLQSLSLYFQTSQPFQLTGSGQLPRLQDLAINMYVSDEAGLDLSWIQQQRSCPSLELTVKFDEVDPVCCPLTASPLEGGQDLSGAGLGIPSQPSRPVEQAPDRQAAGLSVWLMGCKQGQQSQGGSIWRGQQATSGPA